MRNIDKYHDMLKLLETIAEVSSNKNCNNCDTTTKSNSGNNDSEITSSNNTHLVPQWDVLPETSDTTPNSDNKRSIKVILSISIEDQLREVRLQQDL